MDFRKLNLPFNVVRSTREADGKSVHSCGSGGQTSSSGIYGSLYGAIIVPNQSCYVSLEKLLEDQAGLEVFRQYLQHTGDSNLLDFWFACNGLRLNIQRTLDTNKLLRLIKIIYRTYIKHTAEQCVNIRPETRKRISERISLATKTYQIDGEIFADAQEEIESYMRVHVHPKFLASEFCQKSLAPLTEEADEERNRLLALNGSYVNVNFRDDSALPSKCGRFGNGPACKPKMGMFVPPPRLGPSNNPMNAQPGALSSPGGLPDDVYAGQQQPQQTVSLLLDEDQTCFHGVPTMQQRASMAREHRHSLQVMDQGTVMPGTVSNSTTAISAHTTKSSTPMPNSSRQAYYPQLPPQGPFFQQQYSSSNKHSAGKTSRNYPQLLEEKVLEEDLPLVMAAEQKAPGGKAARNIAEHDPMAFARLLSNKLQQMTEPAAETGSTAQASVKVEQQQLSEQATTNPADSVSEDLKSTTSSATSIFQASWAGKLLSVPPELDNPQAILEEHCSKIWAGSANNTPPKPTTASYTNMTTVVSMMSDFMVKDLLETDLSLCKAQRKRSTLLTNNNAVKQQYDEPFHEEPLLEHRKHRHSKSSRLKSGRRLPVGEEQAHQEEDTMSKPVTGVTDETLKSSETSPGSASQVLDSTGSPAGAGTSASSSSCSSSTGLVVGYYLFDERVPYRSMWHGNSPITLLDFKQLIPKRGNNLRFFFKKASTEFDDIGAVMQEITADETALPLFEGKVVAKVERVE